jgi:hypothetical protein
VSVCISSRPVPAGDAPCCGERTHGAGELQHGGDPVGRDLARQPGVAGRPAGGSSRRRVRCGHRTSRSARWAADVRGPAQATARGCDRRSRPAPRCSRDPTTCRCAGVGPATARTRVGRPTAGGQRLQRLDQRGALVVGHRHGIDVGVAGCGHTVEDDSEQDGSERRLRAWNREPPAPEPGAGPAPAAAPAAPTRAVDAGGRIDTSRRRLSHDHRMRVANMRCTRYAAAAPTT